MTDEDDRAAAYRRQMAARAKNKKAVEKRLVGDLAAKKTLEENTKPLLQVDENGVPRAGVRR